MGDIVLDKHKKREHGPTRTLRIDKIFATAGPAKSHVCIELKKPRQRFPLKECSLTSSHKGPISGNKDYLTTLYWSDLLIKDQYWAPS